MKRLIITEEEKNHILNMHVSSAKKNYLTEQMTLLTIPAAKINITQGDNSKQILLKHTDPTTKKTLVLKYNISGSYSFFNFDVEMRNIKRNTDGSLTAEVKPSNGMVHKTLKSLVKKDFLTPDGWLYVRIPVEKINQAIEELKQNRGSSAEIDAGNGVSVELTYSN
jgi:hypothetical protein